MNKVSLFAAQLLLYFLKSFSESSNNPTQISVNCGSIGSRASTNGRVWVGDVQPKLSSLLQIKGSSTTSTVTQTLISADPIPHKTARISVSQFSYAFQVSPGQKILRLHFYSATFKGFKRFNDLFTVEAGPFTLLTNFSVSHTAAVLGKNSFTKEYCISINENQTLSITFSPAQSSQSGESTYAFINGIEIIPLPLHLSYFRGGDLGAQVVGRRSLVSISNATALELIHRENVKQDSVDMLGMAGASPEEMSNLTWRIPVGVGFNYLVRFHFSNLGLMKAEINGVIFEVIINEIIVDTNVEILEERVHRRDYMVAVNGRKQDGERDLLISLHSYDEFVDGYKLINGFEIFKLSNPDNSLASPTALPCARNPPTSWSIQHLLSFLGPRNAIATVVVIIITAISIIVHKLGEIWEAISIEEENKPPLRAERLCRRFSLYEIQSATRDFSSGLIIGRGGFGKVYKGRIDKGQKTVAVKRLKLYSMQGPREFLTEIETLCQLRHVNLISLIGYCNENGEMILVYEYMAGGTLADHLYKLPKEMVSCLSWKRRLNICIGAGRGLEYLHTGHGFIHRDVKASNILLDENFVAKVSDFGLAKPEDITALQTHVSTKIKGTKGYLDPHYIRTSQLTRKSDTYSFGVVLLEVLCGRAVVDAGAAEDARYLPWWVRDKISEGRVDEIVDSSLREEILPDSLKVFVEVAERCLHDEPKKRPTMSSVVVQLEFALELQEKKNFVVPNHVANDVCPSNEGTISSESAASRDVQAVTSPMKQSNSNYSPVGAEVKRKAKPKRFLERVLGGFWNRIKPSEKNALSMAMDSSQKQLISRLPVAGRCRYFPLDEIKKATRNFDYNFMVGEGGFGKIYRGLIDDGTTMVAIKRGNPLSNQGIHEFLTEIEMLSEAKHKHLVSLIGYSNDSGEMILVYDYMAHGTLRGHLYKSQNSPLTWKQRLQICCGTAKGLQYLHAGFTHTIIHRDVKSSNILLDENFVPKLSDFGLSRFGGDETHVSTLVKGSFGYLDPEYYRRQQLTEKSDVYSFGVVLFEVLCARPALLPTLPREEVSLAEWVQFCFRKGTLEQIIDSTLEGQIAAGSLREFAKTAIGCLSDRGVDRPAMDDVVRSLELAMQLQEMAESRDENVANGDSFVSHSPSRALLGEPGVNGVVSWSSEAIAHSPSREWRGVLV